MCESNNPAKMASGVLPAQNGGTLESFDSSEFSLISEQPQEEVGMYYSTNSTALQADLMSARFDLSEEEIQRRLFDLAEDNKSLRETLQQSSAVMRTELSSIAAWHNNITTNMATLKVTLQEAQARIQELEQEKEELMRRNKEDEGQTVENAVVSDEDSEYEIIQKKSKDTEALKSQLKEAELNIAALKHKIEEQNLKIETMQNMYEENEKEKTDLKSKLVNQDELNSRVSDLLNQVASAEETNNALKSKVKKLEEQLCSPWNDELLLNHAEEFQEKTNAMQAEHGRITAKLQEQIKSLEGKLASETQAVETLKIKNAEDKKLLSVVQSNYDRVTKILQMQSRKEKQNSDSLDSERQLESRKNMEQIDNLTARLFDYEQRLEESEARVSSLTKELNLAKEDSEQPTILKAQLEVLKIDLDTAILAKETAQEEAVKAQEQLRELQQAQAASASFCSNCGAGNVHGGRGKRRTHKGSESKSSNPEFLICPICQFGFTELHALENHVETCIDKHQ
ncbi:hypothetical protein JTE90_017832 [Oedothorax gibbosus]|uniref:CCHC NOA-type domain-containing protein n=1 Tax=Oedothorax gibbosus TaxID=931172 RepID=A0AAV6VBM2_9ARAC|nr:hypothetical protein JTE90_017832 [Oedothorax gibbosus]